MTLLRRLPVGRDENGFFYSALQNKSVIIPIKALSIQE